MEDAGKRVPIEVRDWIRKYSAGNITVREHEKLESWIMASDKNMLVFEQLTDPAIKNRRPAINWKGWTVAAIVVISIGTLLLWFYRPSKKLDNDNFQPPQRFAATFQVDNNAPLPLSSIAIGGEAGGIIKKNDSVYVVSAANAKQLHIKTLAGSQITIQLADSSAIVMNALSSVQISKQFNSTNRNISFNGEGYFIITKRVLPFIAEIGNTRTVEVKGTRFTVNNYSNEPAAKITLIEGQVEIKNNGAKETLAPGMQATIIGKNINRPVAVDTNVVLAWSKGYFAFVNEDIGSVSRQMERWYGVKAVVEEGNYPTIYTNFSKQSSLLNFIITLKKSAALANVSGNTIKISPN